MTIIVSLHEHSQSTGLPFLQVEQQHSNLTQYWHFVGSTKVRSSTLANGITFCVSSQHDVSVVVINSPSITTSLPEHNPPQLCSCDISIRLAMVFGFKVAECCAARM